MGPSLVNDDRRRDDDLAPLPWPEEQRLLGVGVKVRRRQAAQRAHEPAVAAHAAALALGVADPADALVAERLATLRRRLLRSPLWRARLRAAGLSPSDLGHLDDLSAFPRLERDDYAAAWRDAHDADGDPELHVATSSGSSGQALPVVRSGYDGVHMWAVIRFWVARLGVTLPPRPRLVLVDALPGGLEYSARAPLFAGGALHRLSTVRPGAAARLRRVGAAIVSTDPAGLHWLAALPAPPRPRLVLSSAQHLAPALRARAEAALGAPIVNYYATTEVGPIAWECLRAPGRFHVLHPDVHVESVDGELVVTRLRDSALPLLRYATGDRGAVEHAACACGARGATIVGFTGREPCAFRTPDGREVDAWALSWLFKDVPLARFQLAQVGAEAFTLALAPGAAVAPPLLVERLRRVLVRLGFARPRITLAPLGDAPAKPRPFLPR
jgi:phenylacetate-CoA ligase